MKNRLKILFIILSVFTISLFHTSLFAQWVQQPIPTSQVVQDIHFLDSLHGWLACSNGAVNDSGLILYTSTGGASWVTQRAANSSPLFAIKMANLNTGYCTGRVILKTTNAGLNWVNMNTGFTDFVKDVSVPNTSGDNVYVVSELSGGGMWRSTNGGVNFTNIYPPADGRTLYFINNQTGWAEVGAFFLVKTTNGGTNWVTLQNFANSIGDIYFVDENTGWILGGDLTGVLKTTNGGLNFIAQQLPTGTSGPFGIFMVNNSNGWIGSISFKIHKTTNSGLNWTLQNTPIDVNWKINFIDTVLGWSSATGLTKTTTGGISYIGQINTEVPEHYKLSQNYPNPFNPQTTIEFSLIKPSSVELKIFDIIGKELSVYKSSEPLNAGTHKFIFDADDLSSGIYFYKLIIKNNEGSEVYIDTKKMVFVK